MLPGYRGETLPDGTTQVTEKPARYHAGTGYVAAVALFWGVFVLSGWLTDPTAWGLRDRMGYGLLLSAFSAIGVAMVGGVVLALVARQEWRVGAGYLQTRERLFQRATRHTCSEGVLVLSLPRDGEGDPVWRLVLEMPGSLVGLDRGDPADLRALGLLLAERTGWPFRDHSSLWPSTTTTSEVVPSPGPHGRGDEPRPSP